MMSTAQKDPSSAIRLLEFIHMNLGSFIAHLHTPIHFLAVMLCFPLFLREFVLLSRTAIDVLNLASLH